MQAWRSRVHPRCPDLAVPPYLQICIGTRTYRDHLPLTVSDHGRSGPHSSVAKRYAFVPPLAEGITGKDTGTGRMADLSDREINRTFTLASDSTFPRRSSTKLLWRFVFAEGITSASSL